jgi:vancomycin permeability regulator SanA
VSRPLSDHVGRSPVRELALVGLAVLVGSVLITGYATFGIWQRGGMDETQPVDAIVVMGAAQYDGHPSPVFASRLDHAVRLYADGVAPIFIVTGGRR